MFSVSLNEVRGLVLRAQGLGGVDSVLEGKERTFEIIDQLGYVQIDTISVVNRSHHHVLWTRQDDYREEYLRDLQETERSVFEYWGHAMAYLPMKDFRYVLPRMENFKHSSSSWVKHHIEKGKPLMKEVMARIRENGPMGSKDFTHLGSDQKGNWWNWKPAKVALEYLFWRGELLVTKRVKFQKVFDLRERVLPPEIDLSIPKENECAEFLILRALKAMAVAKESDMYQFLQSQAGRDSELTIASKKHIKQIIPHLIESKKIKPISIEGINETYYSLPETLEEISTAEKKKGSIHFLSPFDNLIIQRKRVKELFHFDYSLECYKPVNKRIYGYFVFPILWENQLVGRFDPKADRKEKKLIINHLQIENNFKTSDDFIHAISVKFKDFAEFNQCENIIFDNPSSNSMIKKINNHLKALMR